MVSCGNALVDSHRPNTSPWVPSWGAADTLRRTLLDRLVAPRGTAHLASLEHLSHLPTFLCLFFCMETEEKALNTHR